MTHLRRFPRTLLYAFTAVLALGTAAAIAAAQVPGEQDSSPYSSVTIGIDGAGITSSNQVTAAIRVSLEKGWHTYWLNGGDAGFPLSVDWKLPPGVRAGGLQWPAPKLMPSPPLMSYGYYDELVLLVDFTSASGRAANDTLNIVGVVNWLVCADVCLPAEDTVRLSVPLSARGLREDPGWRDIIRNARARLPAVLGEDKTRAWKERDGYMLAVELADSLPLTSPYFFADSAETLEHARPQRVWRRGGSLFLLLPKSEFALSDAPRLRGQLTSNVTSPDADHWLIDVPVTDKRPESDREWMTESDSSYQETGGFIGSASSGLTPDSPTRMSLLLAIGFAFAGGLLLNLMPCVFPVLSLKVLSFVESGSHNPARARLHGLAFGAGVLLSFWLLAGILLVLRAGGESLGWGFQLQSPPVVALFAMVLFGLGLNMSGLFEMGLAFTRLGEAGSGGRLGDSALTGALAVLVATPCTAPFMGAALGFAVVQPPAVGMAVFTSLALGLAAPYVTLSSAPQLLRRLPRAGAWMVTLKKLLAFPIYGTVVWLVWVFGRQAGVDAVAILLISFILIALAAWLWGLHQARHSRVARTAAALLLLAAASTSILAQRVAVAGEVAVQADVWEEFSVTRLSQLRAEGRPVFVDFTAAWCLSCQVNERVALHRRETRQAFAAANAALLRADWTSRDSSIAEVLQSFGRTGVPLYVVYPADPAGTPEILPAVLFPPTVVRALQRAAKTAVRPGRSVVVPVQPPGPAPSDSRN